MKQLFNLLLLVALTAYTQNKKAFKIHTIAFYNLENLFDTINDPLKNDEASPIMKIKTNKSVIYKQKVANMAKVISEIGKEQTTNLPTILGVAEIETNNVLQDLINAPLLKSKNYGSIHFDSPDGRGIDVGLIYQKKIFRPIAQSKHELKIYDATTGQRIPTRDQLLVSGQLENELIHIIVNHWPSRRGGEAKSRTKRIAAAKLNKRIIDSLQSINANAKIIIMGDLNDNPTNTSVKKILKAKGNKNAVGIKGIYNPYHSLFKKGYGSNAHRDRWSLFDQILFTKPFIENNNTLKLYKAKIFNPSYLVTKKGRFKGYPFRSFANNKFTKGYSDHFPVYVFLIKEVKTKQTTPSKEF